MLISINVNLDETQINFLRKQREKTGVPVSFQIRSAVEQYIMDHTEKS